MGKQASLPSSPADPHTPSRSPVSGTCSEQEPQEGRARGWVFLTLSLSLCWPELSKGIEVWSSHFRGGRERIKNETCEQKLVNSEERWGHLRGGDMFEDELEEETIGQVGVGGSGIMGGGRGCAKALGSEHARPPCSEHSEGQRGGGRRHIGKAGA